MRPRRDSNECDAVDAVEGDAGRPHLSDEDAAIVFHRQVAGVHVCDHHRRAARNRDGHLTLAVDDNGVVLAAGQLGKHEGFGVERHRAVLALDALRCDLNLFGNAGVDLRRREMTDVHRIVRRDQHLRAVPGRDGYPAALNVDVEDGRRANVKLFVGAHRRREGQTTQEGEKRHDRPPPAFSAHGTIVSSGARVHHESPVNGRLIRGKTTRNIAPPPGARAAVASPP